MDFFQCDSSSSLFCISEVPNPQAMGGLLGTRLRKLWASMQSFICGVRLNMQNHPLSTPASAGLGSQKGWGLLLYTINGPFDNNFEQGKLWRYTLNVRLKKGIKILHLLLMDDLKLFGKMKAELDSLLKST